MPGRGLGVISREFESLCSFPTSELHSSTIAGMQKGSYLILLAAVIIWAASACGASDEDVTDTAPNVPSRNLAPLGTARSSPTVAPGTTVEPGGIIIESILDERWADWATPDELGRVVGPPRQVVPDRRWWEIFDWFAMELGRVPVIVQLPVPWTPEGVLAGGRNLAESPQVAAQRESIQAAVDAVWAALNKSPGYGSSSIDSFDYVAMYTAWSVGSETRDHAGRVDRRAEPEGERPTMVAWEYFGGLDSVAAARLLVTADELELLFNSGLVSAVMFDGIVWPDLDVSTGPDLVDSMELTTFTGLDGRGTAVAIVDTGVLVSHPAFGGRIVAEACFDALEGCPGGGIEAIGPGAAEPCSDCDHGTHVAGIAAGEAISGKAAGVAPGADIVAIRSTTHTGGFWDGEGDSEEISPPGTYSDVVKAYGHVADLADQHGIVAVNTSMGDWFTRTTTDCNEFAAPLKAAIDNLISINVAATKSSGNYGLRDQVGSPACVTSYITVGASTDGDQVASFSNFHSELVDFMAPGDWIESAEFTASTWTPTWEDKSGTSMAAPHVAGAWAVLRQMYPDLNVATLRELLRDFGIPVFDDRPEEQYVPLPGMDAQHRPKGSGDSIPRLDLSLLWRVHELSFSSGLETFETFTGVRETWSNGTGLSKSRHNDLVWEGTVDLSDAGTIALSHDHAYLYFTVRGGRPESVTISGSQLGVTMTATQVGFSSTPCRSTRPLRTYRTNITSRVEAGPIQLRVEVDSADAIVDGASIVIIGEPTRAGGGIALAHGASVLDEMHVASAAISVDVALDNAPVYLHLGVTDGQDAYESGVLLRTSANARGVVVTQDSMFSGSDGATWDDQTFDLSDAGLEGYPGIVAVSHADSAGASELDCLGLVYAMLNVPQGLSLEAPGILAGIPEVPSRDWDSLDWSGPHPAIVRSEFLTPPVEFTPLMWANPPSLPPIPRWP